MICPTGAKREFLSSFGGKNISVFQKAESDVWVVHPASMRGALRVVTKREAGCDGRDGVDETDNIKADGKAVWSWHPLAGAKFADNAFALRGRR